MSAVAETHDTYVDLRTYLDHVRKEIWVLPQEALDTQIEAARKQDERAEKYAELERKWRPEGANLFGIRLSVVVMDPWVVPRGWVFREGDYPVFIAEHCPEIVDAYDAWAQQEAKLYNAFNDGQKLPCMTPGKVESLKAVAAAYNNEAEELLDRIEKALEAEKFPGKCDFCPDHVR